MEALAAPWLKFYGDTPHTIDYPDKTMYELIEEAALRHPDNVAYEFMGKKTDYRTFLTRIQATAKALMVFGIRKGDRVTIAMPNSPQAVDLFYALNRIGAISTMIHPLSAPGEIAFYLNASRSRAILTLDQFYPKVAEILPALDHPVKVLIARIRDELKAPMRYAFMMTKGRKLPKLPKSDKYTFWNDFMEAGASADPQLPPIDGKADEGASILYSGGTTGTTKGILLSNRNFNALALQTAAMSGCKEELHTMKMLSVMPMFHGFGLGVGIHTALVASATCILVPQFTINTYAKLLKKKKPNLIPGVPTLFEALLRAEKLENADLSFLRGVFSGGDSLSIELKNKVDKFLKEHNSPVPIREGYGTTECVTASCLTPIGYYREGSIGVPFPNTFYKIVKPGTTDEVPYGEEGEIVLSGPTVMLGYVDNPEETAMTLREHADGHTWLHTGDLGVMDADGFVYFRQRIKRMIVTSGYNVYPSQLENIIDGHEKVLYSCVVGVKDPYKMQKVKAYAVLKPGVEPSDEVKRDILKYCEKHIAKYAMPYDIEFRKELPKTLVGKVAYRKLEEEANAEHVA